MNLLRLPLLTIILAISTVSLPAHSEPLSATEQKIIAAVKAHSNESINLLERSVNINSGTMNPAGVRAVGKLFRAELDQLGFHTNWINMPPAMQRAGHLIAEHQGNQGKRVLLIGHLDTVFELNSTASFWRRQGDRASGQGALDMKGGDVIIIAALRALHEVGALANTRIVVMFSGDEEQVGAPLEVARADLINIAKRSDVALTFENMLRNQENQHTATIGRRAIGSFSLTVTGKPGHSAGIFGENGDGAIYEMARILSSFRQQLIEPNLTFNVGAVVGGSEARFNTQTSSGSVFGKKNVIPKIALAQGDLRYLTSTQREQTYARMREIVAQHLPGTSAEIQFSETHPPMPPSAGNLKLLELYSQASNDAGLGAIVAIPPGFRGAGDVQFVAPYVDSLDGLGAIGNGEHSSDEYVELGSIEPATIRAALLIYRLTR